MALGGRQSRISIPLKYIIMSKSAEERGMQWAKQENILNEAVNKTIPAVKELCEETGLQIYAEIQPIGIPTVNFRLSMGKPSKLWFRRNRQQKESQKQLEAIRDRFNMICSENGVMPFAKITEYGAQVFYGLTKEKRESITNIIIPTETGKLLIPA